MESRRKKTGSIRKKQKESTCAAPDETGLAELLGAGLYEVWTALCAEIETWYEMDRFWNRVSKNWDYEYKYRRGGKTLCALYAGEKHFGFMIIFGTAEREKFEACRQEFSTAVLQIYDSAQTYRDGKWMMFEPTDKSLFGELIRLLEIKRRPNKKGQSKASGENPEDFRRRAEKPVTVNSLEELISGLSDRDEKMACRRFQELLQLSKESDAVSGWIDWFEELLQEKNSYRRTRGLLLIAANVRWDRDNRMDRLLPICLEHITDEKPVVSRQFIKTLPEMARWKPKWRDGVLDALGRADLSRYADSMRPLLEKDIETAIEEIEALD